MPDRHIVNRKELMMDAEWFAGYSLTCYDRKDVPYAVYHAPTMADGESQIDDDIGKGVYESHAKVVVEWHDECVDALSPIAYRWLTSTK